jgi:uncharacterized membrane protein (DUF373 family)
MPGGMIDMLKYVRMYEKLMIIVLLAMMAVVLALATIDLGVLVFRSIAEPPFFLVEVDKLLELFGLFMLVIIGLELFETIMRSYLAQGEQHYEVVLSVAIIAIARKVIILDINRVDGMLMIGIAAVVASLTVGYYFMKKAAAVGRSDS